VALKVIGEKYLGDESAQRRFLREARAAATLRHSNVASVLHLGRTGSSYFYAMEFVEGETLEKLVRRSGWLKVNLALEIMGKWLPVWQQCILPEQSSPGRGDRASLWNSS
jgi:serine/threonine protein kinase